MSVLIKGMEMPTAPVLLCIHPDGKVFADLEGGWREYKAVPVPPHGRLGDLDALCNRLEKAGKIKPYLESGLNAAISFALSAPTIIEAEPAEEGE